MILIKGLKNRASVFFVLLLMPFFVGVVLLIFSNNIKSAESNIELRGIHDTSFFDEKLFSDGVSYVEKNKIESDSEIVGGIIPHHLLPSFIIADFFKKIATDEQKTVFIIGPNHYERGYNNAITSDWAWETPFGKVDSDCFVIDSLKNDGLISVENESIDEEHSVGALLPFLKHYLPNARVVPIVLSRETTVSDINKIVNGINDSSNAVFIASVDFSHYLRSDSAQSNNDDTLDAIKKHDYSKLLSFDDSHIDSPQSVVLLMKLMDKFDAKKIITSYNTNSGILLGDDNIDVTSYLGISFVKDSSEKEREARIVFGGDVMMDRYIRQVGSQNDYEYILHDDMESILRNSDMVVSNLEGPITEEQSVSIGTEIGERDNYVFTFDPSVTNFFAKNNLKIFNIGNNHISNFGEEGISSTKDFLSQSGIDYFGQVNKNDENILIKNIGGIRFAFIGFNEFASNGSSDVINKIDDVKRKVDFVVVYTHWGEEYDLSQNEEQIKLAHQFIDNGADFIVGSHPHVIQGKESYKNNYIYYSLGNFIFDQYFQRETEEGLLLNVTFSAGRTKNIEIDEIPIEMLTDSRTITKK